MTARKSVPDVYVLFIDLSILHKLAEMNKVVAHITTHSGSEHWLI